LLGRILSESSNFVLLENLLGNRVLYEKIFNTLHDAESENVDPVISALRDFQAASTFSVDADSISRTLDDPVEQLIYDLTWRCNLLCGYCGFTPGNYEDSRYHETRDITEKIAMSALSLFSRRAANSPFVSFYGGEPLIRQDLMEKIVAASKEILENPNFSMTSNLLLGKRYARFLAENRFYVIASLNGPEDINASRVTAEGINSYRFVTDAIEEMLSFDPDMEKRLGFSVVLTHPSRLMEVRDFFSANYPGFGISLSSVDQKKLRNNDFIYKPEELLLYSEQERRLAKEFIRSIAEGGNGDPFLRAMFLVNLMDMVSLSQDRIPEQMPPYGICTPGRRRLFAGIDGSFGICEKVGYACKIGDSTNGLDDSLAGDCISSFTQYRNELCRGCFAQRICRPCYFSAVDKEGMSIESLRESCGLLKAQAIDKISLYSALLQSAPLEKVNIFADTYRTNKVGGI
jgi:uncharacterized protein